MKKLLLLAVTALITISTGLSLEPMKVAFVYTAGTPTSVQVQLADNTSSNLFQGENFTTGITPNSSGVIVVNVRDHAGSGTTWANLQASSVNTYTTLDIYVNGSLYAQYRLDQLIIAQAQNGILDQDGNLTPPESGSGNIGTDELRWSSAYFEGNTVHIGPSDGEAGDTEMRISYDDNTNTGTITVDDEDVIDATSDLVTINKLVSQVIDGNNTAFGNTAFNGTSSGASNTAVGYLSMSANTSGDNNTAIGTSSLRNNTSGAQNTAVGVDALITNTSGISNTAVGYLSLSTNNANNNTAFGTSSLRFNTSGTDNTAVGTNALISNTTGNNNTATGRNALLLNTTGNNNTANGINSLYSNNTGNYNTATGEGSLFNNTAGNNNTAIGRGSLFINSTGSFNTAAGDEALRNNATGNNNLSLGVRSGYSITSGSNNVFLGNRAGENASQKVDAQNSVAIGANSFTTADNQVVIGNSSILENNFHGKIEQRIGAAGNTALGTNALNNTLAGNGNTAIGVNALDNVTNGDANTAIGFNALSNSTGALGNNTSVGANSLENTTGDGNTALGRYSGNDLTSGNNNLFVGYHAGNNASQATSVTNSTAIGANTFTTANNQVVIGNNSITETQMRGVTLMDLAGGGTQNIQVDNDGKIITGGGGGGGGLPEVTVLTKSSDQTISSNTYTTITDFTTSLDANSTYRIKGFVLLRRVSANAEANFQFVGLPTSGLIFLSFTDHNGSKTMIYDNEYDDSFDIYANNLAVDIDGVFKTDNSGTGFQFQTRRDGTSTDDFIVGENSVFIITKVE